MKKYLKTAFILAAICAGAALALALINQVTAPVIAQVEAQKQTDAYAAVAMGYNVSAEEVEVGTTYVISYRLLTDDSGAKKGYILNLRTTGYGGEILVAASYSLDGLLTQAQVVSSSETPGLGKKSEDPGYMDKYIGKAEIPMTKDALSDEDAAAVSGASITFTGLSRAFDAGMAFVKETEGVQ